MKTNFFNKLYKLFKCKKFYTVIDITKPMNYLTIVKNKKDAYEFVEKYLMTLNAPHYVAWAGYRKLNIQNRNTWISYCTNCLTEEQINKYAIIPLVFDDDRLTSTLRIITGSLPLNCSFDTNLEYLNIQQKVLTGQLSDEVLDLLENNIKLNPKLSEIYKKVEEQIIKEEQNKEVKNGTK